MTHCRLWQPKQSGLWGVVIFYLALETIMYGEGIFQAGGVIDFGLRDAL